MDGRGAEYRDERLPGRRLNPPPGASEAPFRVLVVSEDSQLRRTLIDSLADAGFTLIEAGTGHSALDLVVHNCCDLVVVDLAEPSRGGIPVCRRLRTAAPEIGIVMVRAAGSPEDDVAALDAGADDCIAAPFRFRETVARLSAILRRVRERPATVSPVLRVGELELDVGRRRLLRAGREVHLSPREFDLLAFFMKHPAIVHTHLKLLRSVWGIASEHHPGSLRSYVKSLRRKIETDPARPEYIVTEPWVGYSFRMPPGAR